MHGKQKYREAGYSNTLPPPPPPPPLLLLKLPWRESALSHTNGYSIAEILLVFGIIAGVLIGVWAIYTALSEDADAKSVVAEVRMIREAARAYKAANGNSYNGIGVGKGLVPYLGQSNLSQADARGRLTNYFGLPIAIIPDGLGHIQLLYAGFPGDQACTQVLKSFGEVEERGYSCRRGGPLAQYIPAGQTITGFIGGGSFGCYCGAQGQASLLLTIE